MPKPDKGGGGIIPTPKDIVLDLIEKLIEEHGIDAVKFALKKVELPTKPKPSGGGAGPLVLLGLLALAASKGRL